MERDGKRWLVSPYGEANWAKNARVAGEASLLRSGKEETLKIQELRPGESTPTLKEHIPLEGIVRHYFDAQPDSPIDIFEPAASKYPDFLLEII